MKTPPFHLVPILCIILITSLMATSPMDLMPKDNEIPGWIGDTIQCGSEWIAETIEQLYLVIDGPAEQYIPYGFNKAAYKGYIDTVSMSAVDTVATCIEIFDQTTHENALKVFETVGDTGLAYEFVLNLGDTARIDTSFLLSICLEMVSKNYFLRLSMYNKTDPFKEVLLNIASVLVQNITPIINTHPDTYNKQVSLSILPVKQGTIIKITGTSLLKNSSSFSKISIYNSKGTLIKKLHFKQSSNSNEAVAIWDVKNRKGMKVSSGSYIAVLYVENNCFVEKFILP